MRRGRAGLSHLRSIALLRGSVIPTFLHFNLPLLAAGWLAAQVL